MGTTRVKIVDLSSVDEEKKVKPAKKVVEQKPVEQPVEQISVEKQKPAEEPTEEISQTLEEEAASIVSEEAKSKKTAAKGEPRSSDEREEPKTVAEPAKKRPAKVGKPKKQKHHLGKNYKSAKAGIEDRLYTPAEALDLIAKTSFTKFDPTVEIHLNVSDKNIKGSVAFPHSVGAKKEKKILFIGDSKTSDNKKIITGDEKTIEDIEKGNLKPGRDFDIVYSTPKFMPQLAKVAKILGPKGLMPNPKNGTIIDDIKKITTDDSANSYDFRCDPKTPVIHAKIGKLSAKTPSLHENLKALILAVGPSKITRATLASTMGPGIHLDVSKN